MINSLFFVQNTEGRLPTLPMQHPYPFLSSGYACRYHKKPTVSCCHTSCSKAAEQNNKKNYKHTHTKTTHKTVTIQNYKHTHGRKNNFQKSDTFLRNATRTSSKRTKSEQKRKPFRIFAVPHQRCCIRGSWQFICS